jgi:hypothetical protein
MSPVDENVCDLKMNALTEKITLMLQPITNGISRIEARLDAADYVPRRDFEAKCKEIEDMKRFVWKVSGGLSVVSFLIGLAVKFLK